MTFNEVSYPSTRLKTKHLAHYIYAKWYHRAYSGSSGLVFVGFGKHKPTSP